MVKKEPRWPFQRDLIASIASQPQRCRILLVGIPKVIPGLSRADDRLHLNRGFLIINLSGAYSYTPVFGLSARLLPDAPAGLLYGYVHVIGTIVARRPSGASLRLCSH
jgi:hypothetical protein